MEEVKTRKTFTLDPDVAEWLDRAAGLRKYQGKDKDNSSALANAIIRREMEKQVKKTPQATMA